MAKVRLRLPGTVPLSPVRTGVARVADVERAALQAHTELRRENRSAGSDEGVLTEADEDDVVQLQWATGIIELVRVGDLPTQFGATTRSDSGEIVIPRRRALRDTARGESELALESVQHFAVEPVMRGAVDQAVRGIVDQAVGVAADFVMPPAVRAIEAKLIDAPGLYTLAIDGKRGERVTPESLTAAGPYLVLIHGTFSTSSAAFGALFASDEWKPLYGSYAPGAVLALEHRTVSESPVHNALELARALPSQARLHLISHSRGGLVGDLLCREAWTDDDIEQGFVGERYRGVREDLKALGRELFTGSARRLSVERFVRVAAPAAGTQLAGKRLDQFLNVMLTLIGKVADAGSGWFDFVKAIAVQVVSARTNAAACPGLEAMMPDSPFVRFLNASEPVVAPEVPEQLAVVSGDVSGGPWYRVLAQVFVDYFFRQRKNDFVVDTASMTRGAVRSRGLQFLLQGANADHFSYFRSPEVRKRALGFLTTGADTGFEPLERGSEAIPSRLFGLDLLAAADIGNLKLDPELPTVVFLPGIMGTRLASVGASGVIWIGLKALVHGGIQQLIHTPNNAIEPRGLIEAYYEKLSRELIKQRYNVVLFGYDWRNSIKETSGKLAERIDELLQRSSKPVHLLAHSMGGLVSRGLIPWHRPTWDNLTARGGRLIMLGTPNFGSFVPAQAFTKKLGLVQALRIVDQASSLAQVAQVIRDFPGLIEMLPRSLGVPQSPGIDLFEPAAWNQNADKPSVELLLAARLVREQLDAIPESEKKHMVYVAGFAPSTPIAARFTRDDASFDKAPLGDGTVPWALGLIPNVRTYYTAAEHGNLPRHEPAFAGYFDLLRSGQTARLGTAPDVRSVALRDGTQPAPAVVSVDDPRDAELTHFPSEDELAALALGGETSDQTEAPAALQVSVTNGHLHDALFPIVVGHYDGDPIASAEAVLDRRLGGKLARDHALGIYPGRLSTMRAYATGSQIGQGVIVVGLGDMGMLTRTRLCTTLVQGLLRYAADAFAAHTANEPLTLSLTSVLIGSWGALSIDDSVSALVGALREANGRLRADPTRPVSFVRLELIEIYRDLAGEALRALLRLAAQSSSLDVEPLLRQTKTFRRSRPPSHVGYYNRVAIRALDTETKEGLRQFPQRLEYVTLTQLARTNVAPREIQWPHIVASLERAPHGDRRAAETLFQYLVPFELQREAREVADLVLELDDFTAQVPWELMSTRQGDTDGLVQQGVLRSLRIDNPRRPQPSARRSALVIGEPDGVVPELPGASAEAAAVSELLRGAGYAVRPMSKRPSADECFEALMEQPYQIVHIAAHGTFDPTNPRRSGVVLENGRLLTAAEFENMPETPAIVFLNCCHLGRIRLRQPGAWSANLAKELIRIGVSVVVVAGWAVGDNAALGFARVFYEELLSGQGLMSAVRASRERARRETNGADVTWGAYQVYGAPGFVLPDPQRMSRPAQSSSRARWVAPHEVAEYLCDLVEDVRNSAGSDNSALLEQLAAIESELERGATKAWLADGLVSAAFGMLYGELGRYPEAIDYLKRAARASNADLLAIERLANFEARYAVKLLEQPKLPEDQQISEALLKSSLERLDVLLALSPNGERWSLKGSTLRRFAKLGLGGRNFLAESAEAYRKASELDLGFYPASVALQLGFASDGTVDANALQEALRRAHPPADDGDFWAKISVIELELLGDMARAIKGGAPDPDPARVQQFKRDVEKLFADTGASQRERDSVLSNLVTQRDIAQHPDAKAWYRALAAAFGR
ncbi:MAG TPA: CHAT domain-containing protein [Polyangiaceae bacterium]|nr:CHAT domain-containing protein [Polyangiaceae bacterium]